MHTHTSPRVHSLWGDCFSLCAQVHKHTRVPKQHTLTTSICFSSSVWTCCGEGERVLTSGEEDPALFGAGDAEGDGPPSSSSSESLKKTYYQTCGSMDETRWAYVQTVCIRQTYRTSQSSFLHNQPSWTFELLYATLQVSDCTNSSFPVTFSEPPGHSNWNPTVEFSSV